MKFVHWKELFGSLQELVLLGGKFSKAGAQVSGILKKAQLKDNIADVFLGIPTTNHGETRIQHCVKYDLQGACRLITVQHNNICFLMFAGTHDVCDSWLETNKGIRFHSKVIEGRDVVESTRASDDIRDPNSRLTTVPDFSAGLLWKKLPLRYFDIFSKNLPLSLIEKLQKLTSIISDDDLLDLAIEADEEDKMDLVYDAFSLLKTGLVQEAKSRIDLFEGNVKPIEKVSQIEAALLQSGDEVIMNDDIDPVLFDHFLKTASFQKWMVYLHPGQRNYVSRDFNGPARLSGVSGSGKTSVLIHRAVRLAKEYPKEKILVITLNRALAKMIHDLTKTISGENTLENLVVISFWELCREKLKTLEPENALIYHDKTVKTNKFAHVEHIDDIWKEYFECKNNNENAKVLSPVQKTLITRGVYPADYIRQEFDYVRSALGPYERKSYIRLEREGRSIPLDERYRQNIIDGLASWEKKMTSVGAIDYLGLATSLYKHIEKLNPEYRCILIDEMQDFGSIELKIIRSLVKASSNDIFMCGDFAQSVLTKYHKPIDAGIDVTGRSHSIKRNYRNSREILGAAFDLFEKNKILFANAGNIEILNPEFANFSSSPPLLLKAQDLHSEISYSLSYLNALISEDDGKLRKFCIAICGCDQSEVELLGAQLNLDVLTGDTDVVAGQIFISDLEQTKGFEFDSMLILNCSSSVIPHPALPVEESYRELCKLYVAMTRAKTELIVSYTKKPSSFLNNTLENFTSNNWEIYSTKLNLPSKIEISNKFFNDCASKVDRTAQEVLFLPQAVGLSSTAQEKLLQIVTGTNRFKHGGRQAEWKNFDQFMRDVKAKQTLRAYIGISDGVWQELEKLQLSINGLESNRETENFEKRTLITLPKAIEKIRDIYNK